MPGHAAAAWALGMMLSKGGRWKTRRHTQRFSKGLESPGVLIQRKHLFEQCSWGSFFFKERIYIMFRYESL